MGCNYYARPKATQELKDKIITAVNVGDFKTAKGLMPDEIHIGKSSHGWKFIFNHNDWQYFGKSLESLELFLLACDIFNEYGAPISNESFWEMVEEKKNGMDNKAYFNKYPSHHTGQAHEQEDHFGLFFSKNTEFS